MSLIRISDNEKNIELTNLEAHVALCTERYRMLDENSQRIEQRIELIIQHSKENKKMIISACITIGVAIISYLITALIKAYS